MVDIVSTLVLELNTMLLEDSIIKSMWDGSMQWGDIPGIITNTKSSSYYDIIDDVDDDISDDEIDLLSLIAPNKRVTVTTEAPVQKPLTKPTIPPGIKTVITRNLPRNITVQMLRKAFEKYGPIKDIYIPKNMDKSSPYFGTIKGFALIKFLNHSDSVKAFNGEYGCLTICKNNITVEFAKEDR
jgi:hypothetical protein